MIEVSLFTEREGGSRILGDQIPVLDQKGGSLIFLKETKYFVKHFRFQRKRLSDATQGRKLQWDLLSQSKNVELHSRFDVDFS